MQRLPRAPPLLARVHRAADRAAAVGRVVGRPAPGRLVSGALHRRVLRQPRHARLSRPAAVVDDRRRLGALRRGADRAVSPSASACARRCDSVTRHARPRRGRAAGGGAETLRPGDHRDALRPGAARCCRRLRARAPSCSARSPTSPTRPCCTPTARCCRAAARRASAWNFHLLREPKPLSTVTYYMNHLQRLSADRDFCVTLNRTRGDRPGEGDPHDPLRPPDVHAQRRRRAGRSTPRSAAWPRRTHYCGAYWGWGFHEDGVRQRAARLRAVRGEPVSAPSPRGRPPCATAQRARARRACTRARCATAASGAARRVSLPAVHGLPRPRRAARSCSTASLLWSARRPAPAWFRRADYLGDPRTPLREAVARARRASTPASCSRARSALLTHLRYFGHCFNPVSFYYCYDAAGEHVRAVVAHVTNTPWGERHAYVMPVARARRPRQRRACCTASSPRRCTSRR